MSKCGRIYLSRQLDLIASRRKPRIYRKTLRDKALAGSKRPNSDYHQYVQRPKYPWTQPPISASARWLEQRGIEAYPF